MVDILPLCAYTTQSWYYYFCKEYERIIGIEYKKINLITGEEEDYSLPVISKFIKDRIYSKIFIDKEREWSARDFAHFLTEGLKNTKDKEKIFTLYSFHSDRDQNKLNFILDKYNDYYKRRRKSNELEKLVYCKFYSITATENDLTLIFDQFDEKKDIIPFLYNYGIQNYVKFVQYIERSNKRHFTFEESRYLAVKRIINLYNGLVLNDENLAKNIFAGIFKNSILWEPCIDINKSAKKDIKVIDWRNDFDNILNRLGLREEEWWKEKEETDRWKIIPAMDKLFRK
jgi:hypothetical protein